MKKQKFLFLAMLMALLPGCASLQAPNYSPDYETLDHLKKLNLEKLSVGNFQPNDPNATVNKISLRGSSMKAPEGVFSTYLENAIRSDLKEIGILESSSNTKLNATVLKNDIDISGISKGSGILSVNLTIVKNGAVTLDKVYSTTTQFESSFAGAVAIGIGQREYPNLVRTFLKNVYNDSEFINAIKK
ncbi:MULTISPECIES: hypothetical protein [unclassified Methylophilus]|jgi:hypothetical protein|uniref:hypothetical protein n=1 Tax=unclassified Methylophilus TaxID=2630143 RepID=UPI00037C8772|nr:MULTISPECIES: hypothetical protein [unclassified Methylophilus]HCU83910.1 hypothetical protein [Methylophilus sp.]